MSSVEGVSLRLIKRFSKLPKWQQELIREDMESALENRIRVMEQINSHRIEDEKLLKTVQNISKPYVCRES